MQRPFSERELDLLESSFEDVRQAASAFSERFYARLFERHPELRRLFVSPLERQRKRLVASLSVIVRGLHRPDEIESLLRGIASVHAGYGVEPSHYPIVGENLVAVLGEFVPQWNPELEGLWVRAYQSIQQRILLALEQPSAGCPGAAEAWPPIAEVRELDILDVAAEYLALNRRWRDQREPLSRQEMERWRTLRCALEAVLRSHPPSEGARRRALRVPTQLAVRFSDGGAQCRGLLTDIAEDGLFVATEQPFEPGTQVRLAIVRTLGASRLEIDGTVVWTRARQGPHGPPGMGVRLAKLDPRHRDELLRLVEQALLLTLSRRGAA